MKSYWIEHKGKRTFIADYSGFKADADGLRADLEEAIKDVLTKEPFNSWHRLTFQVWLTVSSKCLSGSACGHKNFGSGYFVSDGNFQVCN